MRRIRVVIVDDQKLFAESLRTLIQTYSEDIEVVALGHNGREAVALTESLEPDLVLMDVRMPVMNGVEATKVVLQRFPKVRVMMLSVFDEEDYVKEALHFGASGYLLKDISPTELIASIRAINEGAMQISPAVATKLVDEIYHKDRTSDSGISLFNLISKRENEIFRLIAKGHSNKQIASELCIAEQTVRNYVSSIYNKLNVKDRFELIQLANREAKNRPERW